MLPLQRVLQIVAVAEAVAVKEGGWVIVAVASVPQVLASVMVTVYEESPQRALSEVEVPPPGQK